MLSAYCTSKPAKHEERNEHGGPSKSQPILPELPQVVVDQKTGKRYFRGRMLGKVRTKNIVKVYIIQYCECAQSEHKWTLR